MTTVEVNTEQLTSFQVAEMVALGRRHPSVAPFHAHWYHQKTTWAMTRYRGVPVLKCPLDLQIYHEMIWQLRPTMVIETGTCFGGSALWFADQLVMAGVSEDPRVVTIDVLDQRTPPEGLPNHWPQAEHPAIRWVSGDSVDPLVVAEVRGMIRDGERVMVVLDSDHTEAHVTRELAAYAPMVSSGQYLVVEDTNISGRPLTAEDPGPGAAVDAFVREHDEFIPDLLCERYLMTMHPGGWLRKR